MSQFDAVCAQIKYDNIAPFVSYLRQQNEIIKSKSSFSAYVPPLVRCQLRPKPSSGSYNLAYLVAFDDRVNWILKVPRNGHRSCFDHLAAESLTSEALTMNMIKRETTIPIPTIHAFDATAKNPIGCPFILMDFLKGKPVWKGWFDKEASNSKREQFRVRCLQTIAVAMVQLCQFSTDRSGSLQFNSEGVPVDIAGAKVPDWMAKQDVWEGIKTIDGIRSHCEKGPFADPTSSFLFMLNRRGVRETDSPFTRGIHQAIRLFTQWIRERNEASQDPEPQFGLVHPDFGLQNFLVEDDGTLCGIIDWDGVATVPFSVGCLKYPDWLVQDWCPGYDDYPQNRGELQMSPEELATYRNIYAQFVEVFSSIACGSSQAGKQDANTTRMSLVAGSLDFGAHDPKLTDDTAEIIFEKLANLVASDDDDDVADTCSSFSIGTNTDEPGGENSNEDTAQTESGSSKIDSEDVWATIAAEVDKGGIPLHLIKKRRDVVAQCIIQNLGREIQLEKEQELESKNDEATQNDESTRNQADTKKIYNMTKANVNVRSTLIIPKLTESGSAYFMPEAENPLEGDSFGRIEFEDATGRESIATSAKRPVSGTHDPRCIRTNDDVCEYLESEPLISVLEADQKMSLIPSIAEPKAANIPDDSNMIQVLDGAGQPHVAVKDGQWFETPRGSQRRNRYENGLDLAFKDQQSILCRFADFGRKSPNTSSKAGGQPDDFEDGEIDEDAPRSFGNALGSEENETPGQEAEKDELEREPEAVEVVDSGYFAFGDVCVALGNGNLDEKRLMRMKAGFMALLDDAVGIDGRSFQWI